MKFGSGSRTLVIFAGLSDAVQPERRPWCLGPLLERYYYRLFADDDTVYLVGRRRNLPAGTATREMAAEYADLLPDVNLAPPTRSASGSAGLSPSTSPPTPRPGPAGRLGVSGRTVGEAGRRARRHERDQRRPNGSVANRRVGPRDARACASRPRPHRGRADDGRSGRPRRP